MSKEIQLSIPGMMCNGCATTIEKALNSEPDIMRTNIFLETKTARVETEVPVSILMSRLKSAGFEATEITTEHENKRA